MRSHSVFPTSLPIAAAVGLCALGLWAGQSLAGSEPSETRSARGPLRVHPQNPRYFADADGRALCLVGAHTWDNLQDMSLDDPPAAFDFGAYLNFLVEHRHNFIRLWRWELLKWDTAANRQEQPRVLVVAPHPWARTAPGAALDGKPKFDLSRFDPAYFDRLRARVQAAGERGIYVAVMLFEGWGLQFVEGAWQAHPFHPDNNVNGIDGDLNKDGKGLEIHTLEEPRVTRLQEAYVRRVIEAVNDLDNALYEISNENHPASTAWQCHMIRFIKEVERSRPQQHPVGMTFQYRGGSNQALFASPADWISPNREAEGEYDYRSNPPPADGSKVIVSDTDHLWGIGGNAAWVWMSFLRGHNPIFMDPYRGDVLRRGSEAEWKRIRRALGVVRGLAEELDLSGMTPSIGAVSSGYCLAQTGREYIVFVPRGEAAELNLANAPGRFELEWIRPVQGERIGGDRVEGGGTINLEAPFDSDAVAHLQLVPQ
jgi:hypothetical protein